MAVKRISYALILVAALVALVITDSGIALFLCIALVVLPLISLVMLAFASKRVKFDCEMRDSCIRGGALQITMRVGLLPRILAGCARVAVTIENTTFRKAEQRSFLFKDLSFAPHVYDYKSADSGRICAKFTDIKLIDIFGIFSVTVKCNEFCESLVSPVLYDDVRVRLGSNVIDTLYGETALPKKGIDISEIFNVRDYAAGDALSAVHWKLSSKFDTLKSKEFGSTDDNRLLVLVDMSRHKADSPATDLQLNGVLDVATSVSDSLKSSGYSHNVGWFDNGVFTRAEVTDANSFVQMVNKLMSIKVTEGNADVLFYLSRSVEATAFTKIIFVSTAINTDELKNISGANITVLAVGDRLGEVDDDGVKIINVPADMIGVSLSAGEL